MQRREALLRRRIAADAVERRIACVRGPNPARENAGDVLVVGLGEGGHEIIAGGRQSEVISEEEIAEDVDGDGLDVERPVCETNLVAPAGGIGCGAGGSGMTLGQPAVGRQAGVGVVEPEIVVGDTDRPVRRDSDGRKE